MENMNSNMGGFNTQPNSFNYQNTQNTNKSSKSGCLIALAAAGGTVIAIGIVIPVSYTHLDVYKRQPLPLTSLRLSIRSFGVVF